MKIKYVDGFEVRRTIMPNFHFCGSYLDYGCEFIPKGEFWVEKKYRNEAKMTYQYDQIMLKLMRGKRHFSFYKARKYVNDRYLSKNIFLIQKNNIGNQVKRWIKEAQKKAPKAYHLLEQSFLSTLNFYFVDGKIIRSAKDVFFVYGGHRFVYNYIPKNEIWLDKKQDPREMKYSFFHELYEYQLMRKGMDYDSAHDFAIAFEKYLKRKDGVANYRFDAEENRSKNKVKKKNK